MNKFQGVQKKIDTKIAKKENEAKPAGSEEKAKSKQENVSQKIATDNVLIKVDSKKSRETLERIQRTINKRGEYGLRGLGNIFK
jgi:hypothetical protein